MKLRGIDSSKGRRAVHERNRALAAPTSPMVTGHMPTPHADGSLECSGCAGMRYSPAAFAAHVASRGVTDAEDGVFTLGPCDPWVAQKHQQPARQLQAAEDADAKRRAEQVAAYYDQQDRGPPRIAAGVSRWIAD